MEEQTITLAGKSRAPFSELKKRFDGLGFTSVKAEHIKLVLEKTESSDLEGKAHNFYRVSFYPDKLVFVYSSGLDKAKRDVEAVSILIGLLKLAEGGYDVESSELGAHLVPAINGLREIIGSDAFATTRQYRELEDRFYSLEKKYKDLALSSERNARMLLECEKKRDEYVERIKRLEGMSDDFLRQEISRWLKTHGGEFDVSQFAKSHGLPPARVEEGLEYLLKNGYLRKIS